MCEMNSDLNSTRNETVAAEFRLLVCILAVCVLKRSSRAYVLVTTAATALTGARQMDDCPPAWIGCGDGWTDGFQRRLSKVGATALGR